MSRQCYWDPECRRDATWKVGHAEVCADHAVNAWVDHATREQRDKVGREPEPKPAAFPWDPYPDVV